jgi:hypothetical protein
MTREKLNITVTRTFPSGAWECFTIYKNELYKKVYFYYTKREAVALFKVEVKEGRA